MPQLDLAIHRLIAQQVRRSFAHKDGALPSVERATSTEQATLINLMKSSKVSLPCCL